MLRGNSVRASANAYCQVFDDTVIIPVFLSKKHASPLNQDPHCQEHNKIQETAKESEMLSNILKSNPYSEIIQNILELMNGFIAAKLIKSSVPSVFPT